VTRSADVVVVGGGPAGSLAAFTLAARGVRVVLLDKKRFPRDKPCGGGIRYSVFRRFPGLTTLLRSTVAIHEIRKVLMESPGGATVLATSERPFYVTLRRTEFDAALLTAARAGGAEVVEGERVSDIERTAEGLTVRTIAGTAVRARIVVGADGVNSIVALAAGLTRGFAENGLAIDTMEETELAELSTVDSDTMYVAYGYKGWPGYGYVFPKTAHVDAGVGFLLSFFKRELSCSPYEHHRRFLEEAVDKNWVSGRSNRANFKAYRLPLGGPLARTYADGVLLAGDAAGFVNAYTGEGIYYAMVTGQLAGDAAASALAEGDVSAARLAAYQVAWQREIGEELTDSLRIQRRLFTHPRLVDRIIRTAAADRELCRLFAAVALGEESLRRRKWAIAARFVLAMVRPRFSASSRLSPPRSGSGRARRGEHATVSPSDCC
jgi:geranylgeranyl reductase family protein